MANYDYYHLVKSGGTRNIGTPLYNDDFGGVWPTDTSLYFDSIAACKAKDADFNSYSRMLVASTHTETISAHFNTDSYYPLSFASVSPTNPQVMEEGATLHFSGEYYLENRGPLDFEGFNFTGSPYFRSYNSGSYASPYVFKNCSVISARSGYLFYSAHGHSPINLIDCHIESTGTGNIYLFQNGEDGVIEAWGCTLVSPKGVWYSTVDGEYIFHGCDFTGVVDDYFQPGVGNNSISDMRIRYNDCVMRVGQFFWNYNGITNYHKGWWSGVSSSGCGHNAAVRATQFNLHIGNGAIFDETGIKRLESPLPASGVRVMWDVQSGFGWTGNQGGYQDLPLVYAHQETRTGNSTATLYFTASNTINYSRSDLMLILNYEGDQSKGSPQDVTVTSEAFMTAGDQRGSYDEDPQERDVTSTWVDGLEAPLAASFTRYKIVVSLANQPGLDGWITPTLLIGQRSGYHAIVDPIIEIT